MAPSVIMHARIRTLHAAQRAWACGRPGPKFTHTPRAFNQKKKIMTDRGVQKKVTNAAQVHVSGGMDDMWRDVYG
jgi:hypothetical protein